MCLEPDSWLSCDIDVEDSRIKKFEGVLFLYLKIEVVIIIKNLPKS